MVAVLEAGGSVPRGSGTRMLVGRTQLAGTVGGGHLEWKAIEQARALLAGQGRTPLSVYYPLGPALGQCCGGAVTLGFALLDAAALSAWPQAAPRFHLQLYGAGHVGRAIVQAHGLPVQGDCTPYDSAGEAQYAYQQMKRLADGFNQKYTEVAWTPQAQAAPAATMGMPTPEVTMRTDRPGAGSATR